MDLQKYGFKFDGEIIGSTGTMNKDELKKSFEENEQKKQNKFFHVKEKGCDIEERKLMRMIGRRIYSTEGFYCNTHNCGVCKCGWEFGFHYGKNSNQT